MSRAEIAKNNFLNGYTCAQAVALAFSDVAGLPAEALARVTIGLGGGMGRLRETCGALSGAVVCLGLIFPEKEKNEIYALVQELAAEFKSRNGSYNCGELLRGANVAFDCSPTAEARTPTYYKKRPCPDLVAQSAEILEAVCKRYGKKL